MKRIISSLLIAILLIVQLTPNLSMVYAQEVNTEDVTYLVDKAYDQESNTTNITVKAQPGFDAITVDSITTPDGELIPGSEVTYVATANGSYYFTINYTSQTESGEQPTTSGPAVTVESDINVDQKTLDVIVEVTDFAKKEELLIEGMVEINETNFPDPKFMEYVRRFDIDNSNTFDQTELDKVEEIGTDITYGLVVDSLEGIEYFTKINKLGVSSDGLKEVDLNKNIELKNVGIKSNYLNNLNVSNNPKLEVLNLFDTPIKTLDLTQNVELKELYINAMADTLKLRTLDLSKNEKLTDLHVNYTKISVLNLSNNPNLVNLDVNYNHLKKLDVSNNPLLETLECNENQLKELNVDGNNKLVKLNASSNHLTSINLKNTKALEELVLNSNQLTELDVTENRALKSIGVDYNQLVKLEVSHLEQLESLYCDANQLTSLDMSKHTSLTRLSLTTQQVYNKNIWAKNGNVYEFDMKKLVGAENLGYILSVVDEDGSIAYNKTTGIITASEKTNFIYRYDHQGKTSITNSEMDVSVNYTKLYSINAIVEGYGSISPSGATWVEEGMDQEYTITPDDGYKIDQLIVNGNEVTPESTNTYTIKDIRSHQTIEAVFQSVEEDEVPPKEEYYIYAAVRDWVAGAVSDGGTISSPGVTTLAPGSSQTYEITPNDGMRLDYLLIDDVEKRIEGLSYTFDNVTQNHRIEAVFAKDVSVDKFNITATAGANGTITPTGTIEVNKGANQEYIITPKDGYVIDELKIDNEIIALQYYFTFLNVNLDHNIEVTFKKSDGQGGVPILESNFPDEDFRRYVRGFDIDRNGVLEEYELAAVTAMQIKFTTGGTETHNLEGIENFTALKELDFLCLDSKPGYEFVADIEMDLSQNIHLEKLDLSQVFWHGLYLKKNVALKELFIQGTGSNFDLSENRALEKLTCIRTSISTIDLSKNTALKELTIENTRGLIQLDLNNNVALEKLELRQNYQLTTVKIDKIDNIKELICNENDRLSDLNVSSHTELKKLKISRSLLSIIDVSNNVELEEIDCNNNGNLRELILGDHKKLKRLDCYYNLNFTSINLEGCTELEVLNIGNTNLSSLNVSHMKNLKELNCNFTQIKKLDVTKNLDLEHLECSFTNIKTLNVLNNKNLKYLSCGGNKLKELNVTENSKLEMLACQFAEISILDVSNCPELKELWCMDNNLTSLDIRNNTKLEALVCHENQLTKLDVSKNINLTDLSCLENQLTKLELTNNMALRNLMASPQKISKDKIWIKKEKNYELYYELNLGDIIGKDNLKYVEGVINDSDETLTFDKNTGIITSNEQCEFSYMYNFQLKNIGIGSELMEVSVRLPGAYSVYASADPNGTITPDGETRIKEGLNQSYTIKPNAGYEIDKLLIDGKAVSPVLSYTFKKIYEDHNIDVTFKKIEGEIPTPPVDPPVNPGGGGGGGDNGGGTVDPPVTPPGGGDNGGGTVDPPVTPPGGGTDNGGGTVDPPVTPPVNPGGGGTDNGGGTITPPVTPGGGGGAGNGSGTVTPPTVGNNTETIVPGNNNRNPRTQRITPIERPNNQIVGKANRTAPTTKLQKPQKEELSQNDLNITDDSNKDGNGDTQHPGFGANDQICILHILILLAALILTIYMLIKRKKDKEEDDDEEEVIQKGYREA